MRFDVEARTVSHNLYPASGRRGSTLLQCRDVLLNNIGRSIVRGSFTPKPNYSTVAEVLDSIDIFEDWWGGKKHTYLNCPAEIQNLPHFGESVLTWPCTTYYTASILFRFSVSGV